MSDGIVSEIEMAPDEPEEAPAAEENPVAEEAEEAPEAEQAAPEAKQAASDDAEGDDYIAPEDRLEYVEADADDTLAVLLKEFLDGKAWTFVIMTATFYALFQVDIGQYFFSKRADAPLAFITLGVFIIFVFEMSLNFILKLDYGAKPGLSKLSFYFWLDFIGTFSLIPDFLVIFGMTFSAPGSLVLARVARTARVGARLTRLMKIFRSKGGKSQYSNLMGGDEAEQMEDSAASTFGEEVSDGISKRVVTLTLTLLMVVPMFLPHLSESKGPALELLQTFDKYHLKDAFAENTGALHYFLQFENTQVVRMIMNDDPTADCSQYAFAPTVKGMGYYALLDSQGFAHAKSDPCFEDHAVKWKCPTTCRTGLHHFVEWEDDTAMRTGELMKFASPDKTIEVTFYMRELFKYDAYMIMLYMLFNIFVFGAATTVFLTEIMNLVINPMERICGALQNLAKSMKQLSAGLDDDSDEFEMLSNSILKLTGMLKTSLGDAGASIIAKNIDAADDSINPMIPGTKMNGYFNFCDVRSFGALMRILNEDIMIFTNEVCGHVHSSVSDHMGMPNKNIGDSWLNVWTQKEEAVYAKSQNDGRTFADHALSACLEIIEQINKNVNIAKMVKDNQAAFDREFGDEGGYTVSMGFGLHYGWAIEGAVGSRLKVDATYLSPNVNLSARLEAATKQYGVDVLVTEEFYKRLGSDTQKSMYKVDRVLVVGSSWPTIMYAYETALDEGNSSINKKTRFAYEHDQALDKYIAGDWEEATKLMQSCLAERPEAKSCKVILEFMSNYGYTGGPHAPGDWTGFRRLTSK